MTKMDIQNEHAKAEKEAREAENLKKSGDLTGSTPKSSRKFSWDDDTPPNDDRHGIRLRNLPDLLILPRGQI